jgi:hypothetical protein
MDEEHNMIIESTRAGERAALLDLAVQTTLFTTPEAEGLLGRVLDELAAQSLPDGHAVVSCRNSHEEPVLGWAYFAPDQYAEHV